MTGSVGETIAWVCKFYAGRGQSTARDLARELLAGAVVLETSIQTKLRVRGDWLTLRRFAPFLLLLLVCSFPGLIFGFKSLWLSDFAAMGLPVAYHSKVAFWAGELPLWNPLSNCGAPFLAQWGTLTLYPFSLVYLLLPLPWSLNVFVLGHLFLAGLGMFCLVRHWTSNAVAGAIAGVAFVFNGATLSCLIWANYMVALGWIPWILYTTRRAWREGGLWILAAVVCASLQLLSGAPELILMTWMATGLVWVFDLIERQGSVTPTFGGNSTTLFFAAPASRWGMTRRGLIIVFLASGLCAIQLLPFLDLFAQSHRVGAFRSHEWSLPEWGLANLLVPVFRYSPPSLEVPQVEPSQLFLTSYYLGLGPLFLALVGVIWAQERLARAFGILTLVAWSLALGDHGILHPLLGRAFPGLYSMEYPVKFVLLPTFLVPVLCGFGLNRIESWLSVGVFSWRRLVVPLGLLVASVVGVALWSRYSVDVFGSWQWVWPNALFRLLWLAVFAAGLWAWAYHGKSAMPVLLLMVGAVVVDAMTHNKTLVPLMSADAFAPGMWSSNNRLPSPKLGQRRVFLPRESDALIANRKVKGIDDRVIGRHLALWSHMNLLDQIPKVNGSSALPIRLEKNIEREIYKNGNTNLAGLLDFLGVEYASASNDPIAWSRRSGAMDWLWLGAAAKFDSDSNLLSHVFSPGFNPRAEVWLPSSVASLVPVANAASGRITAQTWRANEIRASVDLLSPGLMTLAQSYSPHWKAWVDGKPVPLLRANGAFQAIFLPAGLSAVRFEYVDEQFQLGAWISSSTLVVLLMLTWRWRRAVKRALAETNSAWNTDTNTNTSWRRAA